MLQTIDLSSLRTRSHAYVPARARNVALPPEVSALLAADAVVAIGVSGGKDSVACALAVARHLDAIGHTGPRILVHSDLGRVEWKDSGPACERLAAHLGWELLTLQRQAGDMLARWEKRWSNNVERYRDLACVRLILPWSTPSMRFCTSELKGSLINSALNKRFPTHNIVNVTGVRRQESSARSKMPISAPLAPLSTKGRTSVTWNAIIEWTIDEVFTEIAAAGLALHEAYTVYGASRVSCAYCIMSSLDDLRAAASCADNHDVYREMVRLERNRLSPSKGNGGWLTSRPTCCRRNWRPTSRAQRLRPSSAKRSRRRSLRICFSRRDGRPCARRPTKQNCSQAFAAASPKQSASRSATSARADVMRRYDELLAQRQAYPRRHARSGDLPAQASFAF